MEGIYFSSVSPYRFHSSYWCRYDFADDAVTSESAIFILFLNCVWSLLQEQSLIFEFNEEFLIFLADSIYDSRFGTFLFENEKARAKHPNLPSIFDHIQANKNVYINPFFDKAFNASITLLKPVTPRPPIWTRYMLRWNWNILRIYTKVRGDIEAIKTSTQRLPSDVSLKLQNNFFYFTDEFDSGLSFLRSLSVINNPMMTIPPSLCTLTDLTKLTLDDNNLLVVLSSLTLLD